MGGEFGHKIEVDQTDLEWELKEIRNLAEYCTKVMKGDLDIGEEKPISDEFEL